MEVERFYVDDREVEQSEFERELENAHNEAFEQQYDDYFDTIYDEPVVIAGYEFSASYALKTLDPLAYRQMLLEDASNAFTELLDEVYRQVEWDEEYNGTSFRYEWSDGEDEEEPLAE